MPAVIDTGQATQSDADFATAIAGGGTPGSDPAVISVGQALDSGTYFIAQGLLSFDTTALVFGDLAGVPFRLTMTIQGPWAAPAESWIITLAKYDWGGTIDSGDYLDAAALGALTANNKVVNTSFVDGATIFWEFDRFSFTPGGISNFILFNGQVDTPPTGVDALPFYGAGSAYPPTLEEVLTPVCSSATPNTGVTTGGTSVVLAGTGLTGASAVQFGITDATSFTVDSDSQITAVSPAHSAGTVNITVTTSGGTSA